MSTKINAILGCLLAVLYLPSMWGSGFWKQLRTFGWDSVPAVVTSNDLKAGNHGPSGHITYLIEGIEPELELRDYISKEFTFGKEAKIKSFIDAHAPGTRHQVYLAPDRREASLGHFPRDYEYWTVIRGITWLVFAGLWVQRWRKEKRDRALAVDLAHGSPAEGSGVNSGRPLKLEIHSPLLREQYQRQSRALLERERPYPSDEYATVVALLDCYPRMLPDVAHLEGCAECSEITALLTSERLRPGVREFFAMFQPHELSQTARTMRGHLSRLLGEEL